MWLQKALYISMHACSKAPLKAGSLSTTSFAKAGLHEPLSFHPLSINLHMGLLYIVLPPPEFLHPGMFHLRDPLLKKPTPTPVL